MTGDIEPTDPTANQDPSSLKTLILGAIGGVIGVVVFRLLGPTATAHLAAGACAGALIGLLVRHAANRSGHPGLGRYALVSCVTAGLMFGLLLAIPVGLGFYIALRRRRERGPQAPTDAA